MGGMHGKGGSGVVKGCVHGACMIGEMAAAVGSMRPTVMHCCLFMILGNRIETKTFTISRPIVQGIGHLKIIIWNSMKDELTKMILAWKFMFGQWFGKEFAQELA